MTKEKLIKALELLKIPYRIQGLILDIEMGGMGSYVSVNLKTLKLVEWCETNIKDTEKLIYNINRTLKNKGYINYLI